MLKIVMCDDNPAITEHYSQRLKRIAQKHDIDISVAVFSSGEQLLFELSELQQRIDIIYMDILMGRMNGVQVAKNLRDFACDAEIIYLTASDEYVFESFGTDPLNYLIKSETTESKFEEVFLKAVNRCEKKANDCFVIETNSTVRRIPFHLISHFEVQNRVITVYFDKAQHQFYGALDALETQLEERGFIRTHRSYLVNADYIDSIENGVASLKNGYEIPISNKNFRDVKRIFSKYLMNQV